ncbi:MAG: hypothetical protein AAFO73_12455 [Pseudomonadota bacterium]
MRKFMLASLVAVTALSGTTGSYAGNFTIYPGFKDANALVEMATDKGLIIEMVLRCRRKANGQISSGIMTYSKIDRKFCSSRNRCYFNAEKAANDTCGT